MPVARSNGGVNSAAGLSAGSSTAITLALPAGVGVGDYCVAVHAHSQNTIVSAHNPPDGTWINLLPRTTTADFGGMSIWGKFLSAGDPGASLTWTPTSNNVSRLHIMYAGYSGVDTTTPADLSASVASATNTLSPMTYAGLTPAVDDCMILGVGLVANDADITALGEPTIAGSATSEAVEAGGGTGDAGNLRTQIVDLLLTGGSGVAIADATGTLTGALGSTADYLGLMVALRPVATGPPPPPDPGDPGALVVGMARW
jgi:hypothetical protein